MNNEDILILTFKAISNFVSELNVSFGKEHRPLKLYSRLIEVTTLNHNEAIRKHFEAFRIFCTKNRDLIMDKNHKDIHDNVVYSERVFIDISAILESSDAETRRIIWNHIFTISALVDPTSKAKAMLREQSENKSSEADFISNLISKVESNIDVENDNPMNAIQTIMSSGIFTDLVSGMNDGLQNGSLNIGRLMGTVQGMLGSLSNEKI